MNYILLYILIKKIGTYQDLLLLYYFETNKTNGSEYK